MTVREYIGARYVPLYVGEWDNTRAYEALNIVQFAGASYTSLQAVPAGIDIYNEDYWLCSGNYNAQIEQYRQEVRQYDRRITKNANDIAAEIEDRAAADTALSERIDGFSALVQTEAEARQAADTALGTRITEAETAIEDEAQARAAADVEINNAIDAIERAILVCVDNFGAIGDGVTDSTQAIKDAIAAYPNGHVTLYFRQGIYCISETIMLTGDINSVDLELNGCTLKWIGDDSSAWSEGDAVTYIEGSERVTSNPIVMIGVERQPSEGERVANRTSIRNGVIDCNYRASIAIQSVSFLTQMHNLRIHNFQYAGILVGSLNGQGSLSGQNQISDCYFTRGDDMSGRAGVSAIMLTFPDNNVVNCITNRTRYGITLRKGGNSISNTHITIQYPSLPSVSAYNADNSACVRLWPLNEGDTQLNNFTNMYFNMGVYVFYTYRDAGQSFDGANMRTSVTNSNYIFYTTTQFGALFRPVWYGGMWYGICSTNQCNLIYGDYCQMFPYQTATRPSIFAARASEMSFTNLLVPHDHSYMFDAANFVNAGEPIICSRDRAPIPANTYKRVAALVTDYPVATYRIPGAIRFEYSNENGTLAKSGVIMRVGDSYSAHVVDEIGTTALHMYISNSEHSITSRGKTWYIAYLYVYIADTPINDVRLLSLKADSPFVDIYAFPGGVNFEDGTNQNLFTTAGALVQIF